MQYRPEVDGLRAIAVLAVIFSHVGLSGFAGGFIGVDVFFVISGYLITSIILRDIEAGTFSLVTFYERRAKRILPALFFVLLCSFVLFWAIMMPVAFKDYSNSLIAASLSVSNFYFLTSIDYFAPAASETPLLHTWSLAVEEQFYLLFPLLFILLKTYRSRLTTLVVIAVLSFFLCLIGAQYFQSETYYLLPTRAWELLAGAFLAFMMKAKPLARHDLLSLIGLLLIFGSVFGLDEGGSYSSVYTLLPVAGAVLFIGFGSDKGVVGTLLASPLAIWIGRLSFSAYLWHQIIFATWRLSGQDMSGIWTKFELIILVFACAAFTYFFVERPLRYRNFSLKVVVQSTVTVGVICVALGGWGALGKGLPFRLSEEVLQFSDRLTWSKDCLISAETSKFDLPADGCVTGNTDARLKIALWGDSVSAAMAPRVMGLFHDNTVQFTRLFYSACAPIEGVYTADRDLTKYCGEAIDRGLNHLLNGRFDAVILAAAWVEFFAASNYFIDRQPVMSGNGKLPIMREKFEATVNKLLAEGMKVILIDPVPMFDFNPADRMAMRVNIVGDGADLKIPLIEFEENIARAMEGLSIAPKKDFYRINVRDAFCDAECYLGEAKVSYYADRVHYTDAGAAKVAALLKPVLVEAGLLK